MDPGIIKSLSGKIAVYNGQPTASALSTPGDEKAYASSQGEASFADKKLSMDSTLYGPGAPLGRRSRGAHQIRVTRIAHQMTDSMRLRGFQNFTEQYQIQRLQNPEATAKETPEPEEAEDKPSTESKAIGTS